MVQLLTQNFCDVQQIQMAAAESLTTVISRECVNCFFVSSLTQCMLNARE